MPSKVTDILFIPLELNTAAHCIHSEAYVYTMSRRFEDAHPQGKFIRPLRFAVPCGAALKSGSSTAMLTGIAAHDLYHAGQVQLLKRLHSIG